MNPILLNGIDCNNRKSIKNDMLRLLSHKTRARNSEFRVCNSELGILLGISSSKLGFYESEARYRQRGNCLQSVEIVFVKGDYITSKVLKSLCQCFQVIMRNAP